MLIDDDDGDGREVKATKGAWHGWAWGGIFGEALTWLVGREMGARLLDA